MEKIRVLCSGAGSDRHEGGYDSSHEGGIKAGNGKGSLVNACVKGTNGRGEQNGLGDLG